MKILIVSSRFPWPPWRGNQLRTVQWLDALADEECLLMCPPGDSAEEDGRSEDHRHLPQSRIASTVGAAAAFVRGMPVQEGLYATRSSRRIVARTVAEWRPDLAVIQMVRSAWAADAVGSVDPNLPVLFDAIDCMALHYQRAASSVRAIVRPAYHLEAERCRRREKELVGRAAVTTAVSGRDLRALGAGTTGVVVPVSGGTRPVVGSGPPGSPTVLLSGNLGYRPTVQAALWFADRVWSKLRELVPSARWLLVGARPAAPIRRLATRPGIEIHGDVADLEPFLGSASVSIAPMFSGSGVPIKILESMAAAVPVVADPWSAAGLEDPSAVVVAEDETAWIDGIFRLLRDPEEARRQAEKGVEVWRTHYQPSWVASGIRGAVTKAVAHAR